MAASNPFAARFLRPGVVPFLFSGGQSAAAIVERLAACGWRGQIVGPHGSGKSTLLLALWPEFERCGRRPILVTLHQGERQMPSLLGTALDARTLLVVDGYEQLTWWSKWKLDRRCRRTKSGLLVTSHADAGLPLVYETQPSLLVLEQVAALLLHDAPQGVTREDLTNAYQASGGNVRESLFALYDVYQERQAAR